MRKDRSVELEIIDQAKYKPLTSLDLIRIYKRYNIDPNSLLNQFMKNIIFEEIDEETGNQIVAHRIRHISDLIISTILLKTILMNNKDLRYTYSLVNNDDGRVMTVITSYLDDDEEAIRMSNVSLNFSSSIPENSYATVCNTNIEYVYRNRREITSIWLGTEIMMSHNPVTNHIEHIEIGELSEHSNSFKYFLEDLDRYYNL